LRKEVVVLGACVPERVNESDEVETVEEGEEEEEEEESCVRLSSPNIEFVPDTTGGIEMIGAMMESPEADIPSYNTV